MKQQFVPYEIALKLKDKGFDEECLGTYQIRSANPSYMYGKIAYYDIETNKVPKLCIEHSKIQKNSYLENEIFNDVKWGSIAAPLWQQVIDWFLEEHKLLITITSCSQESWQFHIQRPGDNLNTMWKEDFYSYNEARKTAIEHTLTLI